MTRITKEQAAEILNMTTRAVERYTKQNRLSATYEKGRTRPVPMYDEVEVKAFAAALLQPSFSGAVVATQRDNTERDVAIHPSQALERAGNEQGMTMFVAALSEAMQAARAPQTATPPVELKDKLMLTEKEAAAYSGLSTADIERARDALKSIKTGAGWRVKRESLQAYVKKL